MKIGLSTAAFYGKWEVEEAAAHIRGYGAECAEVFFQTRSEYTKEFARLTRDRLDGLPCTSVHPFGTAFENEFFGRSARQRADALDMLRRDKWENACEELPEGQPVCCDVLLEDETGERRVIAYPDAALTRLGIDEGDTVRLDHHTLIKL